jgi:molybdate transport system regulatory protein
MTAVTPTGPRKRPPMPPEFQPRRRGEPLEVSVTLGRRGRAVISVARIALLADIGREGSISAAASRHGLSYRTAWDSVQALNNLFPRPLVTGQPGGARGGTASLTPEGWAVLRAYEALNTEMKWVLGALELLLAKGGTDFDPTFLWSLTMKTSARNMLRGEVVSVTDGAVNSEVVLDLGDGRSLVAGVTREAALELGLAPGLPALALINASDILLAAAPDADAPPLRTSARNDLEGVVSRLETGAVNDEVHVDIGGGKTLVAMVTHASAGALGLAPGAPVRALIKAGHVLLAVG